MSKIVGALARSAKAVAAGIVAAGFVLDQAQGLESDGGTSIVGAEWRNAVIAGVVAFAGIYAIPNRPAAEEQGE